MERIAIPALRALHKLGKDIKNARRRRRITLKLMAERAGLSRGTLSKIEKGDPNTLIASYAAALFVLGMSDRLASLADTSHDLIGQQLEEEKLPQRVRIPTRKNDPYE